MSRQLKLIIYAMVADEADDEAVADAAFQHMADSDDEQTPGVESFDNFEWERIE